MNKFSYLYLSFCICYIYLYIFFKDFLDWNFLVLKDVYFDLNLNFLRYVIWVVYLFFMVIPVVWYKITGYHHHVITAKVEYYVPWNLNVDLNLNFIMFIIYRFYHFLMVTIFFF